MGDVAEDSEAQPGRAGQAMSVAPCSPRAGLGRAESYLADTLVVKLAHSLAYTSLVVPVISSHWAWSVPPVTGAIAGLGRCFLLISTELTNGLSQKRNILGGSLVYNSISPCWAEDLYTGHFPLIPRDVVRAQCSCWLYLCTAQCVP